MPFLDSWYRERRGPPAMRANFDIIEGCTALCVAAAYGHLEVVKMLVEANKYSAAYSGKTYQNTTLLAPKASPTLRVVWVEMAPMSMQLTIPGVPPLMASCCKLASHQFGSPILSKTWRLAIAGKDYAVNILVCRESIHYMKRGMEERFREPSLPLLKQEIELLKFSRLGKNVNSGGTCSDRGKPAAICLEDLLLKTESLELAFGTASKQCVTFPHFTLL
ncbi:hypothetical protein OS493_038715 [Desmophyllum pertusum]|uniref:Uncharacterized protein n=1 Tax=Desmophyllum pertusum TaxID=174260 RepID=A0A9W9Z5V1_9CNID|nr:hypothetical protein OS493_038715 [Desmophyllum pertusum]